jgi:hypothetical protein
VETEEIAGKKFEKIPLKGFFHFYCGEYFLPTKMFESCPPKRANSITLLENSKNRQEGDFVAGL